MPRVELGPAEVKGWLTPEYVFVQPRFGPRCVCCHGDACGRTQDLDPGGGKIRARAIPIPVCAGCRHHAFPAAARWFAAVLVAGLAAIVGIAAIAGVTRFAGWPAIVVCGAVVAGLVAVTVADRSRLRGLRRAGHNPGASVGIIVGVLRLHTTSDALADDVLARNPMARRIPTEGEAAAERHCDRDARAELVAQKILSGKPDDLAQVRTLLATGLVSDVLVDGHLSEVEQTLGRTDLRARYRALREEPRAQ